MRFQPFLVPISALTCVAACGDSEHKATDTADTLAPDTTDTREPDTTDTREPDTADTLAPDVDDTADTGDVTPTGINHMLCHAGGTAETITVDEVDVAGHLDHGDQRGPCTPLAATLVPESHTIIACDGREITPADPAVDTFLFLHDVEDVQLVECVVRFDFAMFMLGGGGHVIRDNELHAASEGAMVLGSHGNQFLNNVVRYGGFGFNFDEGADDNLIEGNDFAPSGVEVGANRPGTSEPHGFVGAAGVLFSDHPDGRVANAFINGELVQIPNRDTICEDNVIRDNDLVGGDPVGIGAMVRTHRTIVQDNRVTGGSDAIASYGFDIAAQLEIPGTCSLAHDRYCGSDEDCDLEGFDAMPLGTCEGMITIPDVDGRVIGTLIEGNRVEGDFLVGIVQNHTFEAVVRDNVVSGGGVGILLGTYSVEGITVTGNVVSDNDVGLLIERRDARFFGADVFGNDFIDNTVPLQSDILAAVDGNYWGRDECPAFTTEDADGAGADCAPFTVSVAAGVPDGAAPCPAATRPRAFDGACAFDAPELVEATGSEASFDVGIGYTGAYAVAAFGLAGEVAVAGTATYEQEFWLHTIEVPAGARHLRIHLFHRVDGSLDDLDMAVFDASCDVFDWDCPMVAFEGAFGATEHLDIELPEATRYVVGVNSWYIDGDQAEYVLSSWAVPPENVNLEVSAPAEVVAGTSATVDVAWPESLAPGSYLGVLEHSNELGFLGSTLLEVVVPAREVKHMLCHGPADAIAETITVAEADVQAHLDHGDMRGPCSPLAATLVPESHTIIDCAGREMTPADPAVDTFLFLHDVEDVHLVNCVVRFDFGVFILGGGQNVIRDNELYAASEVARIYGSDGNRFEDNFVRLAYVGIVIDRDADANVMERNDFGPSAGEPGVESPGSTIRLEGGRASSLIIIDYPFPAVTNVFINGELVQIPNFDTNSDDNVFRDNDVIAGDPAGISIMVRAKNTLVQGNRVTGGNYGLASFGYDDGTPIELPGTCSLAADRWCGGDADCFIEGYDAEPLGVCEGTSLSFTDTRVIGTRWEGNIVGGDFEAGIIQMLTRDAVVEGNTFSGGRVGIWLTDYSIEAIDVIGNTVSGNEVGLEIQKGVSTTYGANVSGNDFIDNAIQIESDVHAAVDGNYWGHDSCPGFVTADTDGLGADCAPYITSVAGGAAASACPAATRPRAFDGICAFDAPALVSGDGGSGTTFEVEVGYTGDYTVEAFGLAAQVSYEGSATAEQEFWLHPIDVPAGTLHLRVRLTLDASVDALDLVVFDASCEVIDWDCPGVAYAFTVGPTELIDIPLPSDPSYVVAVVPWYIGGERADYVLSTWSVPDANVDLEVSAPAQVVAGYPATVEVSWPEALAPGSYLGVLEHSNQYTTLGLTLLEVVLPAP